MTTQDGYRGRSRHQVEAGGDAASAFLARLRDAAIILFALSLTACAALDPVSCMPGEQAGVQDLLYFGTEKPSGPVTPEDWARFLAEDVTPRFPEGLTTWQASGQWRSGTGALIHETSYVLSLVHPDNTGAETGVRDLVSAYKARFRQEAVLRVKSRACMSW